MADSTTAASNRRLVAFDELVACRACDWLHYRERIEQGSRARCSRCGTELYSRKPFSVDRTLAATLAALVLLLMSLWLPFLSLSRGSVESSISVLDAVYALWQSNMNWLGLLSLGLIVLVPLSRMLLLLWVLVRLRFRIGVVPSMRTALRWSEWLEPWAMAEVFMIGVVVSLVKISALASLDVGPAFWTLLGLIMATALMSLFMCRDTLWQLLITRSA